MIEQTNGQPGSIRQSQELAVTDGQVHWLLPGQEGEWDVFVARHPLGLVYHLSSWRRVLETAFRHIRGRFLVLRDGCGQIQAGLPVYTVASWLLGNRIVSVPFATMCDPLISTKEEFAVLWPAIEEVSSTHRSQRVEIRTRAISTDCLPTGLTTWARYKHHYLPLGGATDSLFRSCDKTTIRQRVEQARRAGVTVEESQDEQSLRMLHGFLVATRQRRGLPPMPLAFFQSMHRSLGPDRMGLYLAMHDGVPVGGLMVLKFKGLWTSEYSGTADNAPRGSAAFLNWEIIQRAKESGAECFSFGRTALDNMGLLDHKRRWATREEDLVDFVVRRGASTAQSHEDSDRGILALCGTAVQFLQQYAPAVVQKYVGAFAYRHLG